MLLRVDDGGEIREFDLPFVSGASALDLLNLSCLDVELMEYPNLGMFVDRIDGARNEGPGGFNWCYEVNLDRPECGCADFVLEPGDLVEFRFVDSSEGLEHALEVAKITTPRQQAAMVLAVFARASMRNGLAFERTEAAYNELMGGLRPASDPALESLLLELRTSLETQEQPDPGADPTAAA